MISIKNNLFKMKKIIFLALGTSPSNLVNNTSKTSNTPHKYVSSASFEHNSSTVSCNSS